MDINSDKKNAAIGILAGLCFVLLFTLLGNFLTSECGINTTAQTNKLTAPDIIKSATIYGMSLETPIDQIDALITKSPFECRSNEKKEKNEETQKIITKKFWRCNHKKFKGTSLSIDVTDSKITKINRDGKATKGSIETARALLDNLKIKMDSRENFNMKDSERSTTFKLTHKTDGIITSSMSFRMQLIPVRDPENPPAHDGMLSVAIVR